MLESRPLLPRGNPLHRWQASRLAVCAISMVIVVLALVALQDGAPGVHVTLSADLNSVFDAPISVMKTPPLAYDITTNGDATDTDQSPGMPRDFLEEETAAGREEELLMSAEEKVKEREDGVDQGVQALATYIHDELASVSKEVTHVNEEDTDAIDDIEPQQGPVGPPGVEGGSGHDAHNGQPGPNGLKGTPGLAGGQGPMGAPGLAGGQGVVGSVGLGGRAGKRGQQGMIGREGRRGQDGQELGWRLAGAKCPRGATKTMKLTDCTTKACRLETLYNGVWGSVCGENWGPKSTRTICKALGFPGAGTLMKHFVSGSMLTGSKGHVWLSDVRCKGNEGDIADCQHKGFGKHRCGHYEEVGLCCAPQPWGKHDPSKFKSTLGVRESGSEGEVPLKFQLHPGIIASESPT